jgi:hypothetical protein
MRTKTGGNPTPGRKPAVVTRPIVRLAPVMCYPSNHVGPVTTLTDIFESGLQLIRSSEVQHHTHQTREHAHGPYPRAVLPSGMSASKNQIVGSSKPKARPRARRGQLRAVEMPAGGSGKQQHVADLEREWAEHEREIHEQLREMAEVIREMRETVREAAEQVRLWSDEAREALKEIRATARNG